MNRDQIEGSWKQLKGKVRERWGKITDDEFDQAAGKWDQLVGLVQKRYGKAKNEAEKDVAEFHKSCEACED
ncbi:MAG: CsbD family protein [Salinibacterium sp.]|nr:CsbD family protein [Salinibacterium sp.]